MKKLWIAASLFFLILAVLFTGLFVRAYYQPAEQAIASGKRVEINLRTGEIKQMPVEAEKPAKEEAQEKEAPEAAAEKHDAVKEEEKAAKEAAPEVAAEEKAAEQPAAKEKAEAGEEPQAEAKAAATAETGKEVKEKPVAAEVPKGPRIAIVMAGMGLSRSSTDQALKLPPQVSVSFSPYAADVAEWMKKAAAEKHEVYLDIPMEPKDYPQTDPGPYALLTNLDDARNLERLNEVLKSGEGYHGLVAGPEEHFTEVPHAYAWILEALKEKKLPLYYVARPQNKEMTQAVEQSKLEALGIDLVLDQKLTNEAIDAKLAEAEGLAQKYGYAVVLARPYPISSQRIEEWLKTLEPKGIHLVPLSQAKAQ